MWAWHSLAAFVIRGFKVDVYRSAVPPPYRLVFHSSPLDGITNLGCKHVQEFTWATDRSALPGYLVVVISSRRDDENVGHSCLCLHSNLYRQQVFREAVY